MNREYDINLTPGINRKIPSSEADPGSNLISKSDQLSAKSIQVDSKAFTISHSSPVQIINLFQSSYLITLKSSEMNLPPDYLTLASIITSYLVNKVRNLSTGNSDRLYKFCKKFSEALNSLIVNLNIETDAVHSCVLEAYNSCYSGIESLVSDSLVSLLNKAQVAFNMTETYSKYFVMSMDLETEKQRFIQKYLSCQTFDLKVLTQDFISAFTGFMKIKNDDFSMEFSNMVETFDRKKQELIKEMIEKIIYFCKKLYESVRYEQRELFCCKIGSFQDVKTFEKSEWIRLCTLLTVKEPCILGKIVNISEKSILIPLDFENKSIVLLYSDLYANICLIVQNMNIKVVEGSEHDSVMIIEAKNSENIKKDVWMASDSRSFATKIYTLKNNSLKPSKDVFNIGLEEDEYLRSIVYIKDLDKVIYTTPSKVFSKFLSASKRKEENLNVRNALVSYNREKQIIGILSESNLRIYTIHLQLLSIIFVHATSISSITSLSNDPEFILLIESKLIFLTAQIRKFSRKQRVQQSPDNLYPKEFVSYVKYDLIQAKLKGSLVIFLKQKLRVSDDNQEGNKARPEPISLVGIDNFKLEILEEESKLNSPPIIEAEKLKNTDEIVDTNLAADISISRPKKAPINPYPQKNLLSLPTSTIKNPLLASNSLENSTSPPPLKLVPIKDSGSFIPPVPPTYQNPPFLNCVQLNPNIPPPNFTPFTPNSQAVFPQIPHLNSFKPTLSSDPSHREPGTINIPPLPKPVPNVPEFTMNPNSGILPPLLHNPRPLQNISEGANLPFPPLIGAAGKYSQIGPVQPPWAINKPEGTNNFQRIVDISLDSTQRLNEIQSLKNPSIPENLITSIPQNSGLTLNYNSYSEEESKLSFGESSQKFTFIKDPESINFGVKSQHCTHQCSLQGNCSISSKNQCGILIPEGQESHIGYHRCLSEFHFCDEQCPECGCFCNKELNHKDPHEASEHSKCSDGKTCMEKCTDPHLHYKDCDGTENCIKNSILKGVHNSMLGKDEIECHIYWQILGWNLIAPI